MTDWAMNRSSIEDTKNKPLYNLWSGMVNRCHAPWQMETTAVWSFLSYGGRGISVCDRWRWGDGALTGYDCFVADMGPRPSPEHSVDRVKNDGNYEPGNCRWATRAEQAANQYPRKPDVLPTYTDHRCSRVMTFQEAHKIAEERGL